MDVVHFATRVSKPSLVTYHSDIVRQRFALRFYRPLKKRFLGSVDRIVATSPNYLATSEVLRRYKSKTSVIPIGLDCSTYPQPPDATLESDSRQKRNPDSVRKPHALGPVPTGFSIRGPIPATKRATGPRGRRAPRPPRKDRVPDTAPRRRQKKVTKDGEDAFASVQGGAGGGFKKRGFGGGGGGGGYKKGGYNRGGGGGGYDRDY